MTTALVVSIVVPVVTGTALLALRNRLSRRAADVRGIALQTVIVMVVLLAIAGGVAAVLLTRGGAAVEELEKQDITVDYSNINSETLCKQVEGTWDGDAADGSKCTEKT